MKEVIVSKDISELSNRAADKLVEISKESIAASGRFTVVLSGGSTPKALFRLLSSETYKHEVGWSKTFFFFGDERNVPPDADESNFRMANENLFMPLGISDEKIFRWKTELGDPSAAADDYESKLRSTFDTKVPIFDLIFLGMGADGHTASLFPHTKALDETGRLAVANPVPQMNMTRLTFTYPLINAAQNVAFLIAGADKADMFAKVVDGTEDLHELPSSGIDPKNGRLFWFADSAAASRLKA